MHAHDARWHAQGPGRRTDDGGASFQSFGDGLPQHDAFHLVYRQGLAVAPDGRTLAMASTTGALWASADAGESWQVLARDLAPVAAVCFAGWPTARASRAGSPGLPQTA